METKKSAYDQDFYAGTIHHANLLKEGVFDELDIYNVIKEVESIGRAVRRSLRYILERWLSELLKWQFHLDYIIF